MNYFLVIDAGTGSGRVVLFNEVGDQIAIMQREWTHGNRSGVPGAIDFDTEIAWETIKSLVKGALAAAGIPAQSIKAISCTSMREGIVLYDADGVEIWACSNVDARAAEEVEALKVSGVEQEIYRLTGQTFSLSAPPRLLWVKRHLPDTFARIASFGMISDWITYKLTGKFTFEPSNGSTSALMDTFGRDWNDGLLGLLGLPRSICPPMLEPGTVVGEVDAKLAEEVGLDKKTLVVIGGGDAQLGVVGAGAAHDNDTVILGGSFWQQEVNTSRPVPHPEAKVRVNAHVVPGLWQYEGISFQVGLVMRWFRDGFCRREKALARELGVSTYSILSEMARGMPPGSRGVVAVFSNVMDFLHWKHAAPSLLNFDITAPEDYGTATVFRALMENAAFTALGNLEVISEVTGSFPSDVTFAGGASYSPVWAGILASVLGIPVKVPRIKESTALGAFMCAAVGSGTYRDFADAAQSVCRLEAVYFPDEKEHGVYGDCYSRWKDVYRNILALADSAVLRHMWKAPGE